MITTQPDVGSPDADRPARDFRRPVGARFPRSWPVDDGTVDDAAEAPSQPMSVFPVGRRFPRPSAEAIQAFLDQEATSAPTGPASPIDLRPVGARFPRQHRRAVTALPIRPANSTAITSVAA